MLKKLDLGSVGELHGGGVAHAFSKLLSAANRDCEDRPAIDKARTVTVTLSVKPVVTSKDGIMEVDTEVIASIGTSVPKYESDPTRCKIKSDGTAAFNDMSPDNPNQMTIDEA